MGAGMEGADVEGLERAGRRCLEAADVARQVCQLMEGVVAALSAMSFFAGPWVAPIIAFLTGVVIPWLRNVEQALRSFGNVLIGRAAAQRRISAGLPVNFNELPRYTALGGTPVPLPSGGGGGGVGVDPVGPGGSGSASGPGPLDASPLPPIRAASRVPGGGGGGGGGGGAGVSGLQAVDLSGGLDPTTLDAASSAAPMATNGVSAAAAGAPLAPVRRGGPSAGLVAGLAAGGLLGGAATYAAAARRRRGDTDGSELLGSTTLDRVGERHPDTLTATDLTGQNTESSRAGAPVAERTGDRTGGANT